MKIKSMKCPSCGANISIKDNETKGTCEYCKSEFVIDDGVRRVEHTGTIEITDDTSLKVANTTLNQFKDYDKSLLLYKRLMYKYAHKKDVYIGLIRSITRDFTNNINSYQLREINEYWSKYITLATDKDIQKYESSIKELNKHYWYSTLINMTNDFNPRIKGEDIANIENSYNTYLSFCDDNEKHELDYKYKQYMIDYKLFIKQNNKRRKNIISVIIAIIVVIILATVIFLLNENTSKLEDSLKLSDVNKHYYNIKKDYVYFEQYFKDTVSDLKVTDVKLNNEDKSVDITVTLKNILVEKVKVFNFDIIDDMGPVITPAVCSFTDTDTVDVYSCFTLYDFTDGEMNVKDAKVNIDGIDFKTVGTKTFKVTATDKNGNENSLDVNLTITKTPIEVNINLDSNLIVGKTYDISYSVTPNNVSDTSVTYTYDNNLLSIDNGKVTTHKKGQTEVCAVSNYNNDVKKCITVSLELQCKDTYTFKFDGSKAETITSDEVFCPGTYKIYATVMNRDNFYHIKVTPKDEHVGDYLTIFKNSSYLNEEGKKYVLTSGYTVTTEIGITSVKLVKQK